MKALVLSLPAAGEWYMFTHSRRRNSVFSCRPAGSSNSRACEIPDCIMVAALLGPLLARDIPLESPGMRTLVTLVIRFSSLKDTGGLSTLKSTLKLRHAQSRQTGMHVSSDEEG